MVKSNPNLAIIIFPYLFMHPKEGISVGKFKLLPSFTSNVNSEKPEIKEQLLTLAQLFRLSHLNNVYQWSYIVTKVSSPKQWETIKKTLERFVNVLRYTQLKDLKESAKYHQFDWFFFEITKHQIENDKEFAYYNGLLNGVSSYGFNFRDGKCTNPYLPHDETGTKLLTTHSIESDNFYQMLIKIPRVIFPKNEDLKILRAIEWFNRSFSHYGRGVDLSEAILNVHTALEALLRPIDENRGIKAQIKTALTNLLGNSTQINLWFDQFWKLRNSIVHGDIEVDTLLYVHPNSRKKVGHRHHLTLAREIFTRCLDAIIKVRSEFPLIGLEEEFESNENRVKSALSTLRLPIKKYTQYLKSNLYETISSLRSDDISSSKEECASLGIKFMQLAREEIETDITFTTKKSLLDQFDRLRNWSGKDLSDLALIYADLERMYSPIYLDRDVNEIDRLRVRGATYNFISYATWRLLTFS